MTWNHSVPRVLGVRRLPATMGAALLSSQPHGGDDDDGSDEAVGGEETGPEREGDMATVL